ncbi:MAG: SH3 domain-containing protein [Clostridia bacterium]|nr:SH3 domain-containing protein [Clostridia bacterium]
MKRLLTALLALLLLTAPAMAEEQTLFALVSAETLTLRGAPGEEAEAVGECARGDWLTAKEAGNGWLLVGTGSGQTGYVPGDGVTLAVWETAVMGVVGGMADDAFLNLREQPGYQARVLGVYYNGAPCSILSHENGWYHVRIDGETGYFREDFITEQTLPASDRPVTVRTGSGTLLRRQPSPKGAVHCRLEEGRYLLLLYKGREWSMMGCAEGVGFVRNTDVAEGLQPPEAVVLSASEEPSAIVSNPKPTQVLNLREYPDTDSRSLAQYANGAKVRVLEQGTEWCEVETQGGQRGYMMTAFLRLSNLPEVPRRQVRHPEHSFVNLRALPSVTLGMVLAEVSDGEEVTVVAPGELWYKVSYQGQTGYISAEFLRGK